MSKFKKRLIIGGILNTVFLVLISRWTWKLDPLSWQFFANIAIIALFTFATALVLLWFFKKYGKID